ncbi:F0F1 ATP synthase subunit delta [Thiomicrorhabdus lithotrophica]|uniref:ATP synthase subunit delta n=1 Tax=Thiomicrorhabdus lithotrophica TaxID=2949997 RepID=A0ABY8CCW4_9GAMM|nr:F0F1 ATP synthase subunit delta [Thiomicrorhabdus lithotrophica]WEJ62617.1 F0F1 ATP synthase subunit delta [Thiomicrorhabdus lithotrophica]
MAQLMTIARPYAEAVFALSQEANSLAAWSEELANLATISQDPAMAAMIKNPAYSADQIVSVFTEVMGENLTKEGKGLLSAMAGNKRLSALSDVSEVFETLKAEAEKRVRATVISARKTTVEQKKKLSAALNAKFDAEVEITYEEDASLVGGIKIKVGDWAIDGSAQSQLNKLGAAIAQ